MVIILGRGSKNEPLIEKNTWSVGKAQCSQLELYVPNLVSRAKTSIFFGIYNFFNPKISSFV